MAAPGMRGAAPPRVRRAGRRRGEGPAGATALPAGPGRRAGPARRCGGCRATVATPAARRAGCSPTNEERRMPIAIAGTGLGIIGILVVILLIILILYFVRRA